jgi:hypothetical protein
MKEQFMAAEPEFEREWKKAIDATAKRIGGTPTAGFVSVAQMKEHALTWYRKGKIDMLNALTKSMEKGKCQK